MTNAKLITAKRTGLKKQDRRNFFADFGKWHIEKLFKNLLKYTELYLNTGLLKVFKYFSPNTFCVIWHLNT